MIRFELGLSGLAGLRFAHSPMAEVVASALVLRSPTFPYARWRAGFTVGDLPTLRAVVIDSDGYAPDFLTPVPPVARPSLTAELSAIAATPLDVVAAQVPSFDRDPAAGLAALLSEVREYFRRALWPYWGRLRELADAEIARRGRAAARDGSRAMLRGLHRRLDWDGSALLVGYPHKSDQWALDRHDLTLLPTAFAGDDIFAMRTGGESLWYGPRGYGTVLGPGRPPAPALAALLGATRAAVLEAVEIAQSTGEVAAALGVAPATASHHLTALRDAGLIAGDREGRRLRYSRTALGDSLTGERP